MNPTIQKNTGRQAKYYPYVLQTDAAQVPLTLEELESLKFAAECLVLDHLIDENPELIKELS